MEPEEVFDNLGDSRLALMQAIEGLNEDQLAGQAIDGHWTIKDILGHIISRDELALAPLKSFAEGGPFNPDIVENFDEWNSQKIERKRGFPLSQILKEVARVRLELLAYVQKLEVVQWNISLMLPWGGRGNISSLLAEIARHEMEHVKTIGDWRSKNINP
jgi:uncharacterized damage-inducible protein DinB